MRRGNRGLTSLPQRCRRGDPMAAYDGLPAPLRAWLAQAMLPWSVRSVRRLWTRALIQAGGDPDAASTALTRIEARRIAQDAQVVWGIEYPLLRRHE